MKRRIALFAAPVVVVLLLVTVWVTVFRDRATPPGEDTLLAAHLSGPGTALRDGFTVVEGSSLVGPVVRGDTDLASPASSYWEAVILVTDQDVLGVWNAYVSQVAQRILEPEQPSPRGNGCGLDEVIGFGCALYWEGTMTTGRDTVADLWLDNAPGDVTGRYVLHVQIKHPTNHPTEKPEPPQMAPSAAGGVEPRDPAPSVAGSLVPGLVPARDNRREPFTGDVPTPEPARDRPRAGEPLAMPNNKHVDDYEDFPLLEGSQLLAQYGVGSGTGGFHVILAVDEGADVDRVAAGYVKQGSFGDGKTKTLVSRHDDDVVTTYYPPGGAGGYSAEITTVDRGTGPDYILYELYND
ncbi:MAG: hypothetical protein ACRDTM_14460 [Micromonosporaceae bacterium]